MRLIKDLLQRVGCFVGSGLVRDAKRTSYNKANRSVGCVIHSLSYISGDFEMNLLMKVLCKGWLRLRAIIQC